MSTQSDFRRSTICLINPITNGTSWNELDAARTDGPTFEKLVKRLRTRSVYTASGATIMAAIFALMAANWPASVALWTDALPARAIVSIGLYLAAFCMITGLINQYKLGRLFHLGPDGLHTLSGSGKLLVFFVCQCITYVHCWLASALLLVSFYTGLVLWYSSPEVLAWELAITIYVGVATLLVVVLHFWSLSYPPTPALRLGILRPLVRILSVLVRSYILNRVKDIASSSDHVSVDFDLSSNASWASGLLSTNPYAAYYESDNVLLEVEGSDEEYQESGGLLLSAHWDSVSTAPGATDDGMGVVTLLSMVKYFAENSPSRTVVFNINNGEEDGLNETHVFIEHPWVNNTDTLSVLRQEGERRPLLFRATSRAPLASWSTSRPHANIITSDAFSRGVIRSGTDYSVYEQAGLKGLDFASYCGRSRYHTKYDSIPGMSGDKSKNALWAMMEGTLSSSLVLANDIKGKTRTESIEQGSEPVHFDLFGAVMIVLTFQTLQIVNIILLTVGPVILLMVTSRIRSGYYRTANGDTHRESFVVRASAKITHFLKGFWVWSKFWIALLLGVGFQILLVVGYAKLNPFVIHTHPWLVLVSTLSLAYLTTVLALTFPPTKHGVVPAPEQQKLSILLHQYVLTWVPLVYTTSAVALGGTYFITAWNAVVLLGTILACVEGMAGARGYEDEEEIGRQRRQVRGVHYDAVDTAENGDQRVGIIEETEPTEITPLIAQHGQPTPSGEEQSTIGWWIAQLLVVVPLPVILMSHIAVILLLAMNQTRIDGASPSGGDLCSGLDAGLNGIILIIFIPRDTHNCVAFVSFAHRPRAAGGAFYDYTSRYGAVREDRITLRESMFGEYDFLNIQPKGGKVKTPVEIAQDEVKKGIFEDLTSRLALSNDQRRRARIVKAILSEPELLVLDESLTGLDVNTPPILLNVLRSLHESRSPRIIMGLRIQDPVPECISHIALVTGETILTGVKDEIMSKDAEHHANAKEAEHKMASTTQSYLQSGLDHGKPVVDMKNVNVSYSPRKVNSSLFPCQ
ncbi:uncharacterized protein F5147DRAFT_798447 [Suillus discolor]|uniref:Peptide hydrolase n=1 Tax=Suillus discolor TaxID=1912936 RepID=A0A9P7JUN5_9AGAM|nr:uncharacterized protein F5147DRAFT_798447 [Suillus discolor]KAG2109315.1 hypothetical protein F5147DRAFT_798447 [Suillus discolor]